MDALCNKNKLIKNNPTSIKKQKIDDNRKRKNGKHIFFKINQVSWNGRKWLFWLWSIALGTVCDISW